MDSNDLKNEIECFLRVLIKDLKIDDTAHFITENHKFY